MKNKITKLDLIKSWAIWINFSHSCYSYERLQGLAFGQSMIPIINKIYKSHEEKKEAIERHTEFFNTEPNIGTPIHGYIISLEENKSNGENIENIKSIKKGLMGSMAGMGDAITQTIYTPLMLIFAILSAFESSILSAILSVSILSIIILYISYTGWMSGYYEGKEAIIKRIKKMKNSKIKKVFPLVFSLLLAIAFYKTFESTEIINSSKIRLVNNYIFVILAVFYALIKIGIKEKYLIYTVYIVPILVYFIINI